MATGVAYSVIPTPGSVYNWSVPPGATIASGGTGPAIQVDFGVLDGNITVVETNVYTCQGSPVELAVELQGCNIVAAFSASDTVICLSESVIFTDESEGITPGTSYEWDFGAGAIPATATGSGPHTVNYSTAGLKTVQLIVNNGLIDTLIRNDYISVNPLPLVTIESSDRCGTGTVEFVATPSDGDQVDFSLDGGISVIFTDNTGPFIYSVTVTESSNLQVWAQALNTITGCSGTWDSSAVSQAFEIPVAEEIASAHTGTFPEGYVDVACNGKLNALYYVNGDPLSTYNWNIPEQGITATDTMELIVNWTVPGGDYTLELEKVSPQGCSSAIRDTLVMVSQPDPELGDNISICEGESHTFNLGGLFTSYQWHDFSTGSSYTASTTGEVSVKVWDDYGCSGSDSVMVTLYDNPVVQLGNDTILCGDNSLVLDAGDFAAYEWSTGDVSNPVTVREGAGIVSVTVTDDNGCQASDEIIIGECNPETLLGTIPNTITPNEDGYHDSWEIINIGMFPGADIQIFDRWGRVIYRCDGGYDNDWKGTGPNGKDLPVDTYYYIINLNMKGVEPITGTISIIR
jgi:gliding motility-associated-like protein